MKIINIINKHKLSLNIILTIIAYLFFDIFVWNYFRQPNFKNFANQTPLTITPLDLDLQPTYTILENSPLTKRFRINSTQKTNLAINIPYSPRWKGFIDRIPKPLSPTTNRKIQISAPQGHSEIELEFQYTNTQKIGFALTEIGLLLILSYFSITWLKQIRWKKELILLTSSLLISFLVAELITRKSLIFLFAENCFRNDNKIYHHSFIPNKTCYYSAPQNSLGSIKNSFNSLGMRGDEITIPKPRDEYRILMLGDSFTAAINIVYQETFSKVLEKKLSNKFPNKKITVTNAGVDSYSPLLEYLLLREKGLLLQPDLIILNFDISDISDDPKYYQLAKIDLSGNIIHVNEIPELFPLYKKINFRLSNLSIFYNKLIKPQLFNIKNSALNKKEVLIEQNFGNFEYDFLLIFREDIQLDYETILHWPQKSIQKINTLAQQNKIPLILAIYPYSLQVNGQEWINREQYGFELEKTYSTKFFDLLEQFAKNEKIPVINSLEAFQKSDKFPLYFPQDVHFTPNGHQVFAEELFKHLTQNAEKYGLTEKN